MRKKIFKWHSYLALIAMLPLIIICITGSILVFKVEIDTVLMPKKMQVNVLPTSPRLSLDDLISNIKSKFPNYEVGTWEIFDGISNNQARTDTAYIIRHQDNIWKKVYINQYTGNILSEPVNLDHDLTDWLLDLHYQLLLATKGAFVGFVIALIFLFLAISGIILYRQFWLKFFTLRLSKAKQIFFSDLHKMIGIASSPVLLILAFTGAYWNASVVIHEVSEHIIEEPVIMNAPYHNQQLSIEKLKHTSSQLIDSFTATYLVLPFEPNLDITFYGVVDSLNPLHSEYGSLVSFDKHSGILNMSQDIRQTDALTVTLDSFRKLHFGYFAGLSSKVIWCILGLSPVFLSITGFYLYWQRNRRKNKAKSNRKAKSNLD
ncbi:PepSY domain-containing protein [Pseudoalteromonas sp. C2R02]|uniref:PepSY-associated TM helix domain-containing protein n=1 Tax=Pseudoalteromonas sp. C2R02 TaxID=2841565 RepID=UPI001C0805CF|nr:PepSY-associated TM helix domain-containing protein [Pseudoalteromonas sp. C2R02]MBU2970806.1 PepSY domain-containing protein [Pseudoalteromonas sp. C2R02]